MTKGRWLVVIFLLILAALGTVGMFLYSRGVDYGPATGGPRMAVVVVSEVDIPVGTDLNELIKDDQFRMIQVPEYAVVDGAVTSIDQLEGTQSRVPILANEQIVPSRIKGA